ncbi:serine protease [Bacteroidia bacterium]|nr:serine protease [Bacteroidia bacterium]
MKYFYFFCCLIVSLNVQSGSFYRLTLTDKGNPPYSIEHPEAFLSQKSIDRRLSQGYSVDETDLPIDPAYLNNIAETGAQIRTVSKWLKTVVVEISDEYTLDRIRAFPFVSVITKVGENDTLRFEPLDEESLARVGSFSAAGNSTDYGEAFAQIVLNNAYPLHEHGFKGKGITIAVLDGGFADVDLLSDYFDLTRIIEAKNFSHETGNPYRTGEWHGTSVLSCMLANKPGEMIGTAPEAEFYLLKTEAGNTEYPVEEDYWIAGIEYADSVGVDIATTSLGYSAFDDTTLDHTWDDLDGYTIPCSRAASMACAKGLLLFNSAGNEGNKTWQKVTPPADAHHILTVGAIKTDSIRANFSSWGTLIDGRIKPDVMALGQQVCVVGSNGTHFSNGTSFASPVMAGMGACLWGALPHLTNLEIRELILHSSDRFAHPDEQYGYGIPDFYNAYLIGSGSNFIPNLSQENAGMSGTLLIYSIVGELISKQTIHNETIDLSFLPNGIYLLSVESGNQRQVRKFIKHSH